MQFIREWANNLDYSSSYSALQGYSAKFVEIIEEPTETRTTYPTFGSYLFEEVDVSVPEDIDELDPEDLEDDEEIEDIVDIRFHQFGSGLIIKDRFSKGS